MTTTTTDTVWIFQYNTDTGMYSPFIATKEDAEIAGIEHFPTREEAQEKCNRLNCV